MPLSKGIFGIEGQSLLPPDTKKVTKMNQSQVSIQVSLTLFVYRAEWSCKKQVNVSSDKYKCALLMLP